MQNQSFKMWSIGHWLLFHEKIRHWNIDHSVRGLKIVYLYLWSGRVYSQYEPNLIIYWLIFIVWNRNKLSVFVMKRSLVWIHITLNCIVSLNESRRKIHSVIWLYKNPMSSIPCPNTRNRGNILKTPMAVYGIFCCCCSH